MKKHIVTALLAIVMCLAMLCGCSAVKVFERDVQVILKVDGEYRGCYTVNIFNNAVVPVPEAPQGLMFYGWTADEDWQEKGLENVAISENKGLIRYDDIKDCIEGDELSVTLYPVFGEIPRHDIAIAWYDKEATSGLTAAIIEGFTSNLYKYLNDNGYKTDEMDIVIRPYAGNVGPTCEAIRSDGDIDIMIGWSHADNLTGTGGMVAGKDFLENYGNILINPDFAKGARYAARISDSETCKVVYSWILETYAGEGGPKLDYKYDPSVTPDPEPEPEPEPEPKPDSKVVIGWYAKTGTTGLDFLMMKNFKKGIEEYVATLQGFTSEIEIRELVSTLSVAEVGTAVNEAGDYDILLGMGGNITSTGKIVTKELVDYSIGGKNRNIARLTDDEEVVSIFQWIQTDEVKAYFAQRDAITSTTLVIGWYAKTDTSGLDQTIIDSVNTALTTYLTGVYGKDATLPTITFRPYDGKVGETGTAINTDGDVDLLLGWVANITSTGKVEYIERVEGIAMGNAESTRLIHRLTENDLGTFVFNWLQTDEALTLFKG